MIEIRAQTMNTPAPPTVVANWTILLQLESELELEDEPMAENPFLNKIFLFIYLFIYIIILVRERDGDMPLIRANVF